MKGSKRGVVSSLTNDISSINRLCLFNIIQHLFIFQIDIYIYMHVKPVKFWIELISIMYSFNIHHYKMESRRKSIEI